ncbi:DUF1269 domain-containing family protein [Actinoplanes ianthinogenes]|uniref:DUF1269 domain-containing family protein n=2 Tax=Actinoplanes ianthinogenes TaxID=122358 RepID=A0ABN6CLV4_9ACTN|nr:DUF1269 domain-containing family protein [Actinoplanes ianthinogenes]GGR25644.1 DUF1269 domain-containing family protein [Actinoplanes ianthinogenes]
MGPVQVLVVGFEHPAFSGEILAEFTRLRQAGIVRLVDLLLVSRAEDGAVETLPLPADAGAELGGLVAGLLGQPDGANETGAGLAGDAMWSLADAVPPGSVAAVALIEHLWAGPLTAAIRKAGGNPLEETWLAPDDLAALEALMAPDGRPLR